MKALISLQISVFLLTALGFLVKRCGIISAEGQKNLTDLVIYVILPCNILKSFMVSFSDEMGSDMLAIMFLSVGIQAFSVCYGRLMFRRETEGRRKCLEYGTICSNAGFLGNPIAEGVFGSYGLMLASVFLIPLRIMMWTEGIASFSGEKNVKKAIRQVCTHPCILACAIGLAMLLTGYRFPDPLTRTIQYVGNCNTAMSMMIIGMILADISLKNLWDKTVFVYSLHRLLLIPVIVYLVCLAFPVSATVRGLAVLLTAMPAGATTSILASKYHMEPEFGTKMVIFSTLLSLPSIFLWSIILT